MKRRWLLVTVIVVTVVGGIAFYSASLLLSESVYSNRGTFAYWLTISDVIKNVPEVEPTETPRFFSSAGDGPKLPETAISYRSSADIVRVSRTIGEYLTQRGYRRRDDGMFERGTSIVSLEIAAEGTHTRVQVRENE
jgi:hypothetical protein